MASKVDMLFNLGLPVQFTEIIWNSFQNFHKNLVIGVDFSFNPNCAKVMLY